MTQTTTLSLDAYEAGVLRGAIRGALLNENESRVLEEIDRVAILIDLLEKLYDGHCEAFKHHNPHEIRFRKICLNCGKSMP